MEMFFFSLSLSLRFQIALVGILYPLTTTTIARTALFEPNDNTMRKSQVCKSIVIFVGINHLCAVSERNYRKEKKNHLFISLENSISK